MIPTKMEANFKDHLNAGNNFWPAERIFDRLHDAQQEIVRQIIEQDPSFYVARKSLDVVSGQALYDLPTDAREGTRFIFGENNNNPIASELPVAKLREYLDFQAPAVTNLVDGTHFIIEGNQIRITPTPGQTKTGFATLWYSPSYGNMLYGTAAAGGNTSITFFAGAPNWTSNYGIVDPRDDYYNGMKVFIYSGAGAGQVRKITDFVGATRVATVDSAWTTNPDTTSVFAVMCPVPEDHHNAVVVNAAMNASIKSQRRFRELQQLYKGVPGGLIYELLSWIEKRQDQVLDIVTPVNYGD